MTAIARGISDQQADAAFARLAAFERIVLAVSGGADSMALMVLVHHWRTRRAEKGLASPELCVVTVDHGLRSEAAEEALFVAHCCADLGIAHKTLTWDDAKPAAGLADAARNARYRLLQDYALARSAHGPVAIVTAHHRDDQAETLIMRLQRGTGVGGLSGMAVDRPLDFARADAHGAIRLVRPFLGFAKADLVATLEARAQRWCEDPSNTDQEFERVRVRHTMPLLASAGLSPLALERTARRMADAEDGLAYADRAFADHVGLNFNDEIFAAFERRPFDDAPSILRQRLLHRLIRRFGGDTRDPELSELEDLVTAIERVGKSATTLGGAVMSCGERLVRVWREVGRLAAGDVPVHPGRAVLWDGRFWMSRMGRPDMTITVRPVGAEGYRKALTSTGAKSAPNFAAPARAIHALPGFWVAGELLAVPTLAWVAPGANLAPGTGVASAIDAVSLQLRAEPVAGAR